MSEYDDKAAERRLEVVRFQLTTSMVDHGHIVMLADHLDSARAEIASLRAQVECIETRNSGLFGDLNFANAELARLRADLVDQATIMARVDLSIREIARLRQLCGEAATKLSDEHRHEECSGCGVKPRRPCSTMDLIEQLGKADGE